MLQRVLEKARNFLRNSSKESPPVFLIEGPQNSGIESLYNYVARWIDDRTPNKSRFTVSFRLGV
jgi:hypothetical protein